MANQDISIRRLVFKYGLLLGFIWCIYVYIRFATGNLHTISWFFSSIELVILLGLIYPIYLYKSSNNGILKLGDALKIGMGIGLILALVSLIRNIVLIDIIQNEYTLKTLNDTREEMLINNPNMSPEDIQETIRSKIPFNRFRQFIIWLIFYFLISLIAGAIMRKKKKL